MLIVLFFPVKIKRELAKKNILFIRNLIKNFKFIVVPGEEVKHAQKIKLCRIVPLMLLHKVFMARIRHFKMKIIHREM